MEQLVALPFQDGTVLLSYADDFVLVVSWRGNKLTKTQQTLDLISDKCEELKLKISAQKFRAMMIKDANPGRLEYITVCRVAKILQCDVEGVAQ